MHEFRSTIRSGGQAPTPIARKDKGRREGEGLGGLTKISIRREETRVTDQRGEDRHFNVVEDCQITFRRRKLTVRVVNVSSRGAMIQADGLEPRIGEQFDIRFSDQAKTRCVVRWIRGERIGVEFVNETIFWDANPQGPVFQYRSEPESEKRPGPREIKDREPRQTLLRKGTLYWSGISIPVRLRNISSGGAKIESGRELCPGAEVELDLGEAGFQVAEVRWSTDGQIGLRFADEFDLDALAPAAAALSPTGEHSPDMLKPAYLETETSADSPWAARFERLSMTDLKPLERE